MNDYQQRIRDIIYLRESENLPIYQVAERVEKLLRDHIADQIGAEVDSDVWAPAYTRASNIARGKGQ